MHTLRLAPLLCGLFLLAVPGVVAGDTQRPGVPDKALQKAIDEAIQRGADYLRSVQKQSGMIGGVAHRKALYYEIGTTALGGLALLAAGEKKGDDAVDRAMAYCKRKDALRAGAGSRTTYDTGTLLMFAAAYHRSTGKKQKGKRHGTVTAKDRGNPCKFPPEVRGWVRDMAMWLVSVQETDGGWGYPRPREDMSNTQYALLGLRAARDCGGKVPGRVFKRVIDRVLAIQEKDGPKVRRTVGGEKKGERTYKISSGDRARGWSYLTAPFTATGSMTTAAIGCLAICHDALTSRRRLPIYPLKAEHAVRRAIQDGFSWLDINFTVQRNPGKNAPAWHFYYLYGLERAAIFAGRTLIGEHDWYIVGSRYLLGKQRSNGSWSTGSLGGKEYQPSDVLDTAWAILFLKKATRPMTPIPGPVVTEPESGGR